MALGQFKGIGRHRAKPLRWGLALGARLWIPVVLFLIAAGMDQLTGQRYSSIWGSLAIVGSVVAIIPASRSLVLVLAAYGAVWGSFNLGRAFADNASPAWAKPDAVSRVEAEIFGGRLPSAWLQDWIPPSLAGYAPASIPALVHISFFVAPFVTVLLLWRYRPAHCWRFLLATAWTFGIGLIAFFLLPTSPPWMSDSANVERVVSSLLVAWDMDPGAGNGESPRFWFEPNHLAALPSMHVAIAVLIFLAIRDYGPRYQMTGCIYAGAMSIAVVYLGEHFVLDVLAGWLVALAGWRIAWLKQHKSGRDTHGEGTS